MNKTKVSKKRISDGRALRQVAALPFRVAENGRLEVLVLTSRETRRVVVPKGWPMKGRKDWKSAQIEARQEAGVLGQIGRKQIGQYKYWKRLETHFALVKVAVYPLEVERQLDDWPERHERAHKWLSPEDAATLIDEPELGTLIREFAKAAESGDADGPRRSLGYHFEAQA